MPAENLRAELFGRVHRRIHLTTQDTLRVRQRAYHISQRDVADDDQVDVAVPAQLVARGGPEDECNLDSRPQGQQRVTDDVGDTTRLREKRLELAEDRGLRVSLKVHLATLHGSRDDAGSNQLIQFTLNGTYGKASLPGDLTQIEGLVRVAVQPSEHQAPGTSKQDRSCVG